MSRNCPKIETIRNRLNPFQIKMVNHPLFSTIKDQTETRIFMKNHIFAVWDFMSLLKCLQAELTSLKFPWVPKKNPKLIYFINSIVLGEESDDLGTHHPEKAISHFELYKKAMHEVGSNQQPIDFLIENLQRYNWKTSLSNLENEAKNRKELIVSKNTIEFVNNTLNICENGKVHEVAACFLFGREDPIPKMFQKLVDNFEKKDIKCENFKLYLIRHIEVDGDSHSKLAEIMLKELCEEDEQKWVEVESVAVKSIQSRINLWDGILEEINAKRISLDNI